MSSQRRAPRSGGRGAQENGEEQAIWKDIQSVLENIEQNEREAEDIKNKMFAQETRIKELESTGKAVPATEYKALEDMYRRQVKIQEDSMALIGADISSGVRQNVQLLTAMVKHNEEKTDQSLPRGSTSRDSRDSVSRNGMDLDGPSDSPGPPSAAERQARKLGAGRTSSLPPRSSNIDVVIKTGDIPADSVERNSSRPKVVYAVHDEVAFKRKTGEETDWIQGVVTRVIGEGKSRRYEVKDPYPDAGTIDSNNTYKSSASQMVPIPPPNQKFEEYEIGKRVLALYPSTSTFYRAEVKRMLENGTKVLVLFEEELEGKEVERRMVLNHAGQ